MEDINPCTTTDLVDGFNDNQVRTSGSFVCPYLKANPSLTVSICVPLYTSACSWSLEGTSECLFVSDFQNCWSTSSSSRLRLHTWWVDDSRPSIWGILFPLQCTLKRIKIPPKNLVSKKYKKYESIAQVFSTLTCPIWIIYACRATKITAIKAHWRTPVLCYFMEVYSAQRRVASRKRCGYSSLSRNSW